jgi:hypothetical protein
MITATLIEYMLKHGYKFEPYDDDLTLLEKLARQAWNKGRRYERKKLAPKRGGCC